jgi:hypothetical protein
MRRLALAALLVVACGTATIQPQTLSLGYKKGDTYKYTFHAVTKQTMGMSGMTIPVDVDMTANESIVVNSVDPSGTADLAITLSNMSIKTSAGGTTNTTTGTPDTTVDVKVASDGRITSLNGTTVGGGNPFTAFTGMGGFFMSAVLPPNPVKVGDTWTKDYDQTNPDGSGAVHVTSKSKYLRDETVNGTKSAVVETTSSSTIDMTIDMSKAAGGQSNTGLLPGGGQLQSIAIKGTVTSDVTSWIDPNGHRIVKSHQTGTDDANMTINLSASAAQSIPGLTGPISIKGDQTADLKPA